MSAPDRPVSAAAYGCAGPALTTEESAFFRSVNPAGFVLFQRNCVDPEQLRVLVQALRNTVDRSDLLFLIDQEGGRVQRMRPPAWRDTPAPGRFAERAETDPAGAEEAAWANARLTALDLHEAGINVNCVPLLDIAQAEMTAAIGDRSFGRTPETVRRLARAVCRGTLAGGVLPVIKHMPGHGRARVDSHLDLPFVDADIATLDAVDFAPFKALADLPLGMTAHLLYTALDDLNPGTLSSAVINEVIRHRIGFDGLLFTDDISMEALPGRLGERAQRALAAGCDVVLHCTGHMNEMLEIAEGVSPLSRAGHDRLQRAVDALPEPDAADRGALVRRLDAFLSN